MRLCAEYCDVEEIRRDPQQLFDGAYAGHTVTDAYQLQLAHNFISPHNFGSRFSTMYATCAESCRRSRICVFRCPAHDAYAHSECTESCICTEHAHNTRDVSNVRKRCGCTPSGHAFYSAEAI